MKIRNHIKDSQKAEQYCCNICLDVCVKPARCAGPCKTLFCMRCIFQWSKDHDQCLLRCKNQMLKLNLVDSFMLDFYCLFNKEKCNLPIKSVKQFLNHYKVCKEINQNQYKQLSYKNQFKCNLGHPLQFYIGQPKQILGLSCCICQQQKSCRAICRQCSQFYCVDCRKVPYSKKGCPLGHKFIYHKKSPPYICDSCDCPMHLFDLRLYEDRCCNFGLCQPCYNNAPEQIEYKLLQNNPQFCDSKHKLTFVKEIQVKKCELCKKLKPCSKYCEQCQEYYCLECKIPTLIKNERCPLKHAYILQGNENNNNFCMKCLKNNKDNFRYDSVCNLRLCDTCFQYLQDIRISKSRFEGYEFCPVGHSMFCLIGPCFPMPCSKCSSNKYIKMFCQKCPYFYCQACLPPPSSNGCYFGHQLENCLIQICTKCNKQQPEMMGWKCDDDIVDCFYAICQQCKKQIQQKHKKVQQQPKLIFQ